MIVELSKIYSSGPSVVEIDSEDGWSIDSYIEIMNVRVDHRTGWKCKTYQMITFYRFNLFKPHECWVYSFDERAENIIFHVNARHYFSRHYILSAVRPYELYWRA